MLKPFNEENPVIVSKMDIGEDGLHGDVIVTRVSSINGFENMKKVTDNALAYGEHTGHVHMLVDGDFDVREDLDGTRYFKIETSAWLKHQEHRPVLLPAGLYRAGFQLEYDPFTKLINKVRD